MEELPVWLCRHLALVILCSDGRVFANLVARSEVTFFIFVYTVHHCVLQVRLLMTCDYSKLLTGYLWTILAAVVMPNQIVSQNQEMLELWTYLPDDILMHIFQFLPAASLLKAAQVGGCSQLVGFPWWVLYVGHVCLSQQLSYSLNAITIGGFVCHLNRTNLCNLRITVKITVKITTKHLCLSITCTVMI